MCEQGLDWDVPFGSEELVRWLQCHRVLERIKEVQIPGRHVQKTERGFRQAKLIKFCDSFNVGHEVVIGNVSSKYSSVKVTFRAGPLWCS